jgi:hypothetical protein
MRKKSLVVLALTVLVALAATSVHAQTFTVRANIPFDFYVGSSAMPAGEYTFDTLMGHGVGHLWSADSIRNVTVLFQSTMLPTGFDGGSASLVFHRYDKTYFLSEVRNGTESADCLFPTSADELRVEKSASLRSPDEEVVVLARR